MNDDGSVPEPVFLRLEPGFACGLASSLVGATVFLASPLLAILAAQIWAHGDRTRGVVELHAWLARIAVGLPTLLVGAGLWFGIMGWRRARQHRVPATLPIVGVLLNLAACGGWVLASIGLINTTESMLQMFR